MQLLFVKQRVTESNCIPFCRAASYEFTFARVKALIVGVMKLEHLSLILGLTKNELKRRLELGLIDPEILNQQVSEYSENIKLDALCDSWTELQNVEQFDRVQKNLQAIDNSKQ